MELSLRATHEEGAMILFGWFGQERMGQRAEGMEGIFMLKIKLDIAIIINRAINKKERREVAEI